MKSSCTNYPGIKRIGIVDVKYIPKRVDLKSIVGEEIIIYQNVDWVAAVGNPECQIKSQKDNHTYTEEVELSFVSPRKLKKSNDVAVIVEDINGDQFLIGSREHPHAVISAEGDMGIPDSKSKAWKYNVYHKAYRTFIHLIAFA